MNVPNEPSVDRAEDMRDDVKSDTESMRALLDETAIRRLLHRYSRAVDRGDLEALREIYHPDAHDDHAPVYAGHVDGFIDFLAESLAHGTVTCTRHCISTINVEVDGDVAVAESYFDAYHRRAGDEGCFDELAAGRYLDRLERRAGTWRIAARRVVWDHMQRIPAQPYPWELDADRFLVGRRSTDDESVRWFRDRGPS